MRIFSGIVGSRYFVPGKILLKAEREYGTTNAGDTSLTPGHAVKVDQKIVYYTLSGSQRGESFAGVVGSTAFNPGNIIAGALFSGAGQFVTSTVSVSQTITPVLVMGFYQRLTQSVSTNSIVGNTKFSLKNLATQVSVTTANSEIGSPWTHFTQILVEVGYKPSLTPARLTQFVVEVLYKRDTRQSLTSNVTVGQTVAGSVPVTVSKTVTSTATVTSTPSARDDHIRLSVSNSGTVTTTIAQHGPIPKTVTSTATVATTITKHGPVPVSVTNTGTATQTFIAGGVHNIPVTSNVTVSETSGPAINPDRQSLTSAVTVTQGVGFAGISDFISVNTLATVSQSIAARSTVNRQGVISFVNVSSSPSSRHTDVNITVVSNITVTQGPTYRNTNVRIGVVSNVGVSVPEEEQASPVHEILEHDIRVTSDPEIASLARDSVQTNVTVTSTPTCRNTNLRLSVSSTGTVSEAISYQSPNVSQTSTATVAQAISLRNSNVRLTVNSNITVAQAILEHPNHVRLTVTSNVTIQAYNYGPGRNVIDVWVNPNRQGVFEFATVDSELTGGNSHRQIGYTDTGTVSHFIRTNAQVNNCTTEVQVHPVVNCSPNPNRQTVETDVAVTGTIGVHNDTAAIQVTNSAIVSQTVYGQGPIVTLLVRNTVLVVSAVQNNQIVVWKQKDQIQVASNVTNWASPDRQWITSSVSVGQGIKFHNTNNRQTVTHPINVGSRVGNDMHVRSIVHVGQVINRSGLYHILQKLDIEDDVQPMKQFVEHITQTLELGDDILHGGSYSRSITDQLTFADPYRNVWVDFNNEYIPVPIVIGVKVDKFVTITAKSQTIVLPPPQFDDSQSNVSSVEVKRSITGLSVVHVKRTDRRKLNWPFKIGLDKALELRLFMQTAISQQITVTDWNGHQWVGFFTCNPFEFVSESRYVGQKEKIDITLEFEAIKLT